MSSDWLKDNKNIFLTLDELKTPPITEGLFKVMVNRHWMFLPDSTTVLYKGRYPQCNPSELLTKQLSKKVEGSSVVHIPVAYVPYKYDE